MVSYLYDAPAGVVGAITRVDNTVVEPGMLDATTPPTAFGQPVKINPATGKFQLMGAAAVAGDFYGILTRIVPSISGTLGQAFADGAPNADQIQGIATRGYVNVACVIGTPVRDGIVYVRIVDGGAGKPVGQYEATADGANSVAVTELVWATNGKDSTNIAEVRIAR